MNFRACSLLGVFLCCLGSLPLAGCAAGAPPIKAKGRVAVAEQAAAVVPEGVYILPSRSLTLAGLFWFLPRAVNDEEAGRLDVDDRRAQAYWVDVATLEQLIVAEGVKCPSISQPNVPSLEFHVARSGRAHLEYVGAGENSVAVGVSRYKRDELLQWVAARPLSRFSDRDYYMAEEPARGSLTMRLTEVDAERFFAGEAVLEGVGEHVYPAVICRGDGSMTVVAVASL